MKTVQSIQEGSVGRALSLLNGVIIFGFTSSLILIPQAHWWFGLAALFSSLMACGVFIRYLKLPLLFTMDDYMLVGALVFFGAVWWWSVIADGRLPMLPFEGGRHLYLWPFIAALFLLAVRVFTPSLHWLWLGVCCGGLGAGLIAIYERGIVGLDRADNGINAIPFGNLSLLMSALSLVAGIYCIQQRRQFFYWLTFLAFSAAFLGFLASLLSGTRGGWLAIPFLVPLLLPATKNFITSKTRNIAILFIVLIATVIVFYPPTGVLLRLSAIYDDSYQYFVNNEAGNSLGMRFELWRAGWIMFVENPIMGVGEGAVQEWLNTLASSGVLYDRIFIHRQLHSDMIDTLARRGLVGLASLLFLYYAFASAFAKKVLQANDCLSARLLAISGMMVIIAFFDFGLSQSMLRDLRGLSGFLGFGVALWGCLAHQSNAQAHPSTQHQSTVLN